ncbi:MAG: class I SAM-dependent methyltransferase [Pseudomonadota bacterium]
MPDATFWDSAAAKYAASPIKDMAAYEATLERARAFLYQDASVLEIGCGTGSTALLLAPSVRSYLATDISDGMLRIAKAKLLARGPDNLQFRRAAVMADHPEGPFDAICAFSIMHLVDDLQATLAHLFDQVKPGGVVISKTACLKEMNALIRLAIPPMQWIGKAPHVLTFSAADLESAFQIAGFDVVEARYFGKNNAARFIVARKPS